MSRAEQNRLLCQWMRSIRVGAVFSVVGALVAACGSSAPTESGVGVNTGAGGSSSNSDGASGGQIHQGVPEAAPDGPAIETESATPIGDSASADTTSALRDAAREAAIFTDVAKIMVVGSSNEEITCWRAFLWQKLRGGGITNFDFVGSRNVGPDCGVAGYDKDCEARSGSIVTSVSADTYHGWFAAHPPDIVLMHNGGADLMSNIPASDVIKTYSVIVEQARAVNPKVIFLVAQHTPQEPTGCTDCLANVLELNGAIPGWAMQISTPDSPVSPVDLYTGLDLVADFSDRVHLNTSGSEKVSDRWLAALLPFFKP